MPSYKYRCPTCNHTEEHQHRAGERLVLDCPRNCGVKLAWCFPTPYLQTDTEFLRGKPRNGFFSHQLNRFVTSRADVKRICEEEGLGCDGGGGLSRTIPQLHKDPGPYRPAPDLVDEEIVARCEAKGIDTLREDDYENMKESVAVELAGTLGKKP